jgi:hypothetical protein
MRLHDHQKHKAHGILLYRAEMLLAKKKENENHTLCRKKLAK